MNAIEKNLFLVNQKISNCCKAYGHKDKKPTLIAVSKIVETEKIIFAINAGCKNFGENYIKEAEEKWPALKAIYTQIKLHFIGKLQSNKVAQAIDLFDYIQSLDSEKLAIIFKKEIAKTNKNPEIFIQINIGEEEQKGGIDPRCAKDFIGFAKQDCGLNITGLMCVPPSKEAASPYFALLAKIARENNLKNLSMGMTADFEDAIALEATHLRVGRAIFGERK